MQYTRENLKTNNKHSIVDELEHSSGIYRIILSKVSKIDRLIGSDSSAIMYIGHAKGKNTLCKMIRDFYDSESNINVDGNPPTTRLFQHQTRLQGYNSSIFYCDSSRDRRLFGISN